MKALCKIEEYQVLIMFSIYRTQMGTNEKIHLRILCESVLSTPVVSWCHRDKEDFYQESVSRTAKLY